MTLPRSIFHVTVFGGYQVRDMIVVGRAGCDRTRRNRHGWLLCFGKTGVFEQAMTVMLVEGWLMQYCGEQICFGPLAAPAVGSDIVWGSRDLVVVQQELKCSSSSSRCGVDTWPGLHRQHTYSST